MLLGLLPSCMIPVKYADVTDESEYSSLVGRRYRLVRAMDIYGANAPPGYGKEIDFYVISRAEPGLGGRWLISKDSLGPGTTLTVQRILQCCFGWTTIALVALEPYAAAVDAPIQFDLQYLTDAYVESVD